MVAELMFTEEITQKYGRRSRMAIFQFNILILENATLYEMQCFVEEIILQCQEFDW